MHSSWPCGRFHLCSHVSQDSQNRACVVEACNVYCSPRQHNLLRFSLFHLLLRLISHLHRIQVSRAVHTIMQQAHPQKRNDYSTVAVLVSLVFVYVDSVDGIHWLVYLLVVCLCAHFRLHSHRHRFDVALATNWLVGTDTGVRTELHTRLPTFVPSRPRLGHAQVPLRLLSTMVEPLPRPHPSCRDNCSESTMCREQGQSLWMR